MNTLILYCSKYGATEKCVNLINDNLRKKADVINLKNYNSTVDINDYNTILIGGGVYAGRVQSELTEFVKTNEKCLQSKNIGVFLCCKDEEKAMEYIETNFPNWLIKKSFMLTHLGHEININKMNFAEKFLLKSLFKIKESYSELNHDSIDKIVSKIDKLGVINE